MGDAISHAVLPVWCSPTFSVTLRGGCSHCRAPGSALIGGVQRGGRVRERRNRHRVQSMFAFGLVLIGHAVEYRLQGVSWSDVWQVAVLAVVVAAVLLVKRRDRAVRLRPGLRSAVRPRLSALLLIMLYSVVALQIVGAGAGRGDVVIQPHRAPDN